MNLFDSIILGIVQGITEFLPVSSTGHLILAGHLLKIPASEFLKSFDIAIQSGTMLAVIALYWKTFLEPARLKKILAAFIPTAFIGFVMYKLVKHFLLGNASVVLWSLLIGGICLIVFERRYRTTPAIDAPARDGVHPDFISYKQAILIGLCQSLAIIPGVSRSAATILGGLSLGLPRKTIVEFSFLLAVPTLLAATALDLIKSKVVFTGDQISLLFAGTAVSFIVGMIVIQLFLNFVRKHTFTIFGIYRILLALLLLLIAK
ncbi:MAG: undecaprenyl-diphosphate phosphatase [Candidatus Omnitrophota bacterium]